jgi:aconitate hydratase/homoaconitate hydratase
MCLGIASDRALPGEVWLSSQNRNFHNRMGKGSMAWLASAATVAASSFDLQITDPRPLIAEIDVERWMKLVAPKSNLPNVVHSRPHAQKSHPSPAEKKSNGALSSKIISGRAQLFGDHIDTDAIIAGEFCHLSDLKEIGSKAFYHFRPEFVKRVAAGENIIVAGEGWGSGSSREHAAWALKGAGVQAIIARSFAYIHKRNLVNEAIPFLIVRDAAFYEAIKDGEALEVDCAAGTVHHRGKTFHGETLPPIMTRIIGNGGLVPHVKKRLGRGE